MTNNKEILPQYRDQLETEIKDIFLWVIGQNAITEMAKTVREREPSSIQLFKLYILFRLHFTPERNFQHSRANFFDLKREDGESAADVWKRKLEKLRIRNKTAAELLASKLLSVIGKSEVTTISRRKWEKATCQKRQSPKHCLSTCMRNWTTHREQKRSKTDTSTKERQRIQKNGKTAKTAG